MGIIKCTVCGEEFGTDDALNEHVRSEIIKCTVCGEEFGTYDALNEHVRSETEDKKHKNHQGLAH
jgi:DNA-directed RNA polymerase subunit RPC12/RpoP